MFDKGVNTPPNPSQQVTNQCEKHFICLPRNDISDISDSFDICNCILTPLLDSFNLLTTNVPRHIETSQLICSANQLTGF